MSKRGGRKKPLPTTERFPLRETLSSGGEEVSDLYGPDAPVENIGFPGNIRTPGEFVQPDTVVACGPCDSTLVLERPRIQ